MQYKKNFIAINLILKEICNNKDYLFRKIPVILVNNFAKIFQVIS